MSNFVFVVLILLAVVAGLVNIAFLFMWLKGISYLAFPSLRFLVAIPVTIILFGSFQLTIVIVASFIDRYKATSTGFLIH